MELMDDFEEDLETLTGDDCRDELLDECGVKLLFVIPSTEF